jgi:nucleoid-associated protein YgaU
VPVLEPVSEPVSKTGSGPIAELGLGQGLESTPQQGSGLWADEACRLSAEVAAQSALLQQLLADLQQLLPSDLISDASVDAGAGLGAGATCRRQINELSARLQQQQLSLTEAQRRAEKAEKLAAAMDQAQAKASTEIERLSAELEMANARQAESLQHAVELERRLATAEARLARVGDHGLSAETRVSTEALSASASASLGPGDLGGSATRAPVLYEVRADDTLSRISARVYGDAGAWERIYEANRDLLVAPDALSPGMSLVIP